MKEHGVGWRAASKRVLRSIENRMRPVLTPNMISLIKAVKSYRRRRIFKHRLRHLDAKRVIRGGLNKFKGNNPTFGIVHWNAPSFLLLNIKQLELLYPNSKIYVLDNGSQPACLKKITAALRQFNNVTLFSARPKYSNHTVGLQFLLNFSAAESDKILVFLDQDCLLSRNIDALLAKLGRDILLIGPRDYVTIPKDYGPLKKGKLRNAYNMVHASLMILQPRRILDRFGETSLFSSTTAKSGQRETYHGISYKALGHILYLETSVHQKIPLLTRYSYRGITYAWHAWYSSRSIGLSANDLLDGVPVSWLQNTRKLAYDFMTQIYESTCAHRKTKQKKGLIT